MAMSQNKKRKTKLMAMSKLRCAPNKTETDRTLDLSSIVENIDTYSKGQSIECNKWRLDDLLFSISCYPQGSSKADDDYISIFFQIAKVAKNDCRKVEVTLKHNTDSFHIFAREWGWRNAISHSEARHDPILHINMKLNHDPLFIHENPSQTLAQQLEKMHNLSASEGDISLIVKLNQENGSDAPPLKKRKLNKFQCEVCDKQFDGMGGLKSHQSDKRDDAHKKYKNNKDIDLELNEIKVSSMILRSASNVFERILSANMRETQEKKIEIFAKRVKDVRDLTYFMSTNKLNSDCNAVNMIELAHYYEMDRLFWQSVNKSIKDISVDNFANTINIFDKYEITKGYGALVDFAKKNTEKLQKADDFDRIPHSFKCIALNMEET